MVTFSPPVASWSFPTEHTRDELWATLNQATAALLHEHKEDPFDDAMQKRLKVRILSVVLYWQGQGWLKFTE